VRFGSSKLLIPDAAMGHSYDQLNAHNMDVCRSEVSDSGESTDVCRALAFTRKSRKTTVSLVMSARLFSAWNTATPMG
jgi:fructoselysine-6-P-deglycase FrlB-like protein